MNLHRRFTIGVVAVLSLIILVMPTTAIVNASNSARPMQSHDFTDVPVAGQEFMEPFINAFYHQGITGGCSISPLQYCPSNSVTRGSMAVFIGRALGYVQAVDAGYDTRAYFWNQNAGTSANGVIGQTTDGRGVYGRATDGGAGVFGQSNSGFAVSGSSNSGIGIQGASTTNIGVVGTSGNSYGIQALSAVGSGVHAFGGTAITDVSTDSIYDIEFGGELGEMFGPVIHLFSDSGITFDLDNNSDGTDSFSILDGTNEVIFSVDEAGNMSADGTKSAIVSTVHYGERKLYAVESPENWFEDFGSAALVDGEIVIEIDPIFAETVNVSEEYHVFLTPIDGWADLYVTNRTETSFTVRSTDSLDVEFSYRIVAKRLGYEDVRLEEVVPSEE